MSKLQEFIIKKGKVSALPSFTTPGEIISEGGLKILITNYSLLNFNVIINIGDDVFFHVLPTDYFSSIDVTIKTYPFTAFNISKDINSIIAAEETTGGVVRTDGRPCQKRTLLPSIRCIMDNKETFLHFAIGLYGELCIIGHTSPTLDKINIMINKETIKYIDCPNTINMKVMFGEFESYH